MRYLIHVIDEASIHERNKEGSYVIAKGESEEGQGCQVSCTDCFYAVDAETHIDAVVAISDIAKIKDSSGNLISLSDACVETKKEIETADVGDENSVILTNRDYDYSNNSESEILIATCQIPKIEKRKKWIELHKVYFYIVEENKVVYIK